MEHLEQHLEELWDVDESDREKAITLLQKIFAKILIDPSNPKFRDLDFAKIKKKLDRCQPAIILLFDTGFTVSEDGDRLQWELSEINISKIRSVHEGLTAKQESHSQQNDAEKQVYSQCTEHCHRILLMSAR